MPIVIIIVTPLLAVVIVPPISAGRAAHSDGTPRSDVGPSLHFERETTMAHELIDHPDNKPYFLTFQLQHRDVPHPFDPTVTPDRYDAILAPDEETARSMAYRMYGTHWALLYDFHDWRRRSHIHPRLGLHRITTHKVEPTSIERIAA